MLHVLIMVILIIIQYIFFERWYIIMYSSAFHKILGSKYPNIPHLFKSR